MFTKENVYHYWQHDKKGIIDKWGGQSGKEPWQERTEILLSCVKISET